MYVDYREWGLFSEVRQAYKMAINLATGPSRATALL